MVFRENLKLSNILINPFYLIVLGYFITINYAITSSISSSSKIKILIDILLAKINQPITLNERST